MQQELHTRGFEEQRRVVISELFGSIRHHPFMRFESETRSTRSLLFAVLRRTPLGDKLVRQSAPDNPDVQL